MSYPVLGSTGTGPVVDRDGRPLRALTPFDSRAEAAEASARTGPAGHSARPGPAAGHSARPGPAEPSARPGPAEPSARPGPAEASARVPEPPADHAVVSLAKSGAPDARAVVAAGPRVRVAPLDRRAVRVALGTLVPVVVFTLWHVLTTVTGTFAPYELPSPTAVWQAGIDLAQRGELWTHVQISTQRVLVGFAIGSVAGLCLGALVGLSRLGEVLLVSTLGALRAVPSLAWIPLLILWMKLGEDSKVTLVAIGAFFPVYTTVASGLRHVDPHLVEAGRAYGLRGLSLLGRVQLPAATPSVVSGLRLALAQSWLFLVAAELIGSSMGLGFLLLDSQNNGRVDRILLAIVILAVLGKTTDALVGVVEKRLLKRW